MPRVEGTDIIYLHISIILSTSCRCRLLRTVGSAHQGPAVCQVGGVRYFSIYSSLMLVHLPNSTVSNIWIFWYCEVSSCTTLLMEGSTILSSEREMTEIMFNSSIWIVAPVVLQKGESFSPRVMAGMELTSFAPSFSARPGHKHWIFFGINVWKCKPGQVKHITITHIN